MQEQQGEAGRGVVKNKKLNGKRKLLPRKVRIKKNAELRELRLLAVRCFMSGDGASFAKANKGLCKYLRIKDVYDRRAMQCRQGGKEDD